MASLFISYSRRDIESARKLSEAFKGQDLDFWIDWEGIPPTVEWWEEIEKGIEEADIFLFLLSPDSAKSKVCRQEIEHAAKNGKRLVPVLVRETRSVESPDELRRLNWISLLESDDFNTGFGKLITAIQTDYEWVQEHRQLQVKALEWDRSARDSSFLLHGKELQDAELQLATNTSKEPHPTDLQREYALSSRQASDRRRRTTMGIAIVVAIVLGALGVFGWFQAGLATERADIANTAQARAEEQAKIALARQLSAQAQALLATGSERQTTAVLLAVQSMRLFPSADATQILQNNTLARPVTHFTQNDTVYSVAFSPDGKSVVSGGLDGTVVLWDVARGKEIARMTHEDWVYSVAFSPDGAYVLSAGNLMVCVWEVPSGSKIACMLHENDVTSATISPDGNYVASAAGRIAYVWNAATGTQVSHVTHEDVVSAIAFRADAKTVVSGSLDGTALLWEAATGEEISRFFHDGGVHSLAVSPDSRYVAAGGLDAMARVWEASTGREISAAEHYDSVSVLAFSQDSSRVISAGAFTAQVWDVATGEELSRWSHNGAVLSVTFSPNGGYAASASLDGTVRVWEASSGREIARMSHDHSVWSIAFSADGKHLVTGGCKELDEEENCLEGSLRVWAASSGKAITTMEHEDSLTSLVFSPDGRYLASGGNEGTVHVWETSSGREIAKREHGEGGASLAFSRDGNNLLSAGGTTARVWEVESGREIAHMAHGEEVWSTAFSPDGKYVVSGSHDGIVRTWEVASSKTLARMTLEGAVHFVAYSADGAYIIAAGDTSILVWETTTGREAAHMEHGGDLLSVAVSPDGKFVVSGGLDGTARAWEVSSGKEIARVAHGDEVSLVAVSPDGKYAVSCGCDRVDVEGFCIQSSSRVWEVSTGQEIARRNHDGDVTSVAFSPDGKSVITGECDRLGGDFTCVQASARVWEISSGNEIARLPHTDWIYAVAFSPDGNYVATGGGEFTARIWLWEPGDLIEDACAYLLRNLTASEWEQYVGDALEYQAVCPSLPVEQPGIPTPTATPLM
jgi:WD40 repeat protein